MEESMFQTSGLAGAGEGVFEAGGVAVKGGWVTVDGCGAGEEGDGVRRSDEDTDDAEGG